MTRERFNEIENFMAMWFDVIEYYSPEDPTDRTPTEGSQGIRDLLQFVRENYHLLSAASETSDPNLGGQGLEE